MVFRHRIAPLAPILAVALVIGVGTALAEEHPPVTPSAAPDVASDIKTKPAKPPASIPKVILKTSKTGDGHPIVYPSGTAQVTARDVIFPPGSRTPMHRHPVPLFAYMLEGELTITTEGEPPRHYKAGDAFMETSGWHVGHNSSDKPARMISVYMGSTDQPLSQTRE